MIRDLLNNEDKIIFDKIENHTLLGATNHIKAIGDMIENIANSQISNNEKIKNINKICNYYIDTRGKSSASIVNAIKIMIYNINNLNTNDKNFKQKIISQKNLYFEENKNNIKTIIDFTINLSKNYKNLMVFDYSSTVEKFLIKLKEDNIKRELYIPESRIINGGKPFLDNLEYGYNIHFIPDSSILYFSKYIDACYMGAETLFPDGTCFNTIGSDLVAISLDFYKKPLYFLTPLIKLDFSNNFGYQKKLVINDLNQKYMKLFENDNKLWVNIKKIKKNNNLNSTINFNCPELINVNPKFISKIICEKGVISPENIFIYANEYYEKYLKNI